MVGKHVTFLSPHAIELAEDGFIGKVYLMYVVSTQYSIYCRCLLYNVVPPSGNNFYASTVLHYRATCG